jgi:hypothetical protein
MVRKKQPPAVYFVQGGTHAAWLTLSDIADHELTEEQKELVAAFEQLAQTYDRQVPALNSKLISDYQKLLKKHPEKADNAIVTILDETLHQLLMRKYNPGLRKSRKR